MKNKYIHCSKLSEAKFRELLRCFCLDLDAGQTAAILRANRNTLNRYLRLVRERIARMCEEQSPFGAKEAFHFMLTALRDRPPETKGGRSWAIGAPAFGAAGRDGRVFTEIPPEQTQPVLKAVMRGKAALDGLGDALVFRGYDWIMQFGCARPHVLYSDAESRCLSQERFATLGSFWNFARRRIVKFQGIPKVTFNLHLKECEFRFNNRGGDIYSLLLSGFREHPIAGGPGNAGGGIPGLREARSTARPAAETQWSAPRTGSGSLHSRSLAFASMLPDSRTTLRTA